MAGCFDDRGLLHDLQGSFSARKRQGFFVVRLSVPLPAKPPSKP